MLGVGFLLLRTPEQAIELVETLVRIRFGQTEVDDERPYVAEDLGYAWKVSGTNLGHDAISFFPARSVVVVRKTTGELLDFHHETRLPDKR